MVDTMDGNIINFSQSFSCPDCQISIDEIEPRSFSFNNPFGACPDCFGLGYKMEFDVDLMIPDKSLSISEGAITVMGWQSCTDKGSFTRAILDALANEYHFSLDTPFQDYPEEIKNILIHGTNGHSVKVYYKGQRGEGIYDIAFPGLIKNVEQRYKETGSDAMKQEYESFMRITPCKTCKGQRLKKESLAVTVGDKNIYEITALSIEKLCEAFQPAGADRKADPQGNPCASWFPCRSRSGLSFFKPCDRDTFRGRGAEDPSCDTDRLRAGRSCLYPG